MNQKLAPRKKYFITTRKLTVTDTVWVVEAFSKEESEEKFNAGGEFQKLMTSHIEDPESKKGYPIDPEKIIDIREV